MGSDGFVVFGEADSGSVAVEAALTLIGAPYEVVETSTSSPEGAPGTPLGQVPALRLPSGDFMTESAAILIWLADSFPDARLAPAVDSPRRAAFLRWMIFVSSAIYAHYWARDFPSRVIDGPAGQAEVRERLEARIAYAWSFMEAGIQPAQFLMGDRITVLDLYVTVVSGWTDREGFHGRHAPRIGEVVRRVERDPRLIRLWSQRLPLRTL